MTAQSEGPPREWLPPWWPRALAACLVVGATMGMGWSVARSQRLLEDRTNMAVAAAGELYLSTVTPRSSGGNYQAARLVSTAIALASTSFWPGGLQVALGRTPLLGDTISLLPLDDQTRAHLAEGSSVPGIERGNLRVSLVPLLDRDRKNSLGWVAAWGTIHRQGPVGRLLLVLIALAGAASAWYWVMAPERIRRRVLTGTVVGVALAAGLLYRAERVRAGRATDTRLELSGRLLAIAATAHAVRREQLRWTLPGLAIGPAGNQPAPEGVERLVEHGVPQARLTVATSGGQDQFRLQTPPDEAQLGGLARALLGCLLVFAAGLALPRWLPG